MRVATGRGRASLRDVPQAAKKDEELGYDIFTSSETQHEPFLPLVLAAEHTQHIALRTSVAIAFPRSPMAVASLVWDLQAFSGGRVELGLGSQVRGHIVRRFSTSWAPPAPRMREYVQALRAIWKCWQEGTRLNFQGDHYSFSLMSPFFNPGPIEHPHIPVYISAMNTNMLRVAGEVCDGISIHSFTTPKYTREIILPNLEAGAKKAGRSLKDLEISGGGFIVTGETEEELERKKEAARTQIAFYASTRSYHPVMKAHGWDATAEKLYRMSVEGRWESMGREITDEMLDEFAVLGTYDDMVDRVKARYGDYATSIGFSIPIRNQADEEHLKDMIRQLKNV